MSNFAERLDDFLVKNLAYFNYRNYAKELNLQGNERVLEVGCREGNLSRFLAEGLPYEELICIDNSRCWIEKSKSRLEKTKNIVFKLCNVLDLKTKDYFDIIAIHYVLHDITKEEIGKAINILSGSLKENGKIFIKEPTREGHGIPSNEIRRLMSSEKFLEITSKESYFFPLRGRIYIGAFQKSAN